MRIAITADTHLRRKDETPERYRALEFILEELTKKGIDHLIIAGDTFDKDFSNYADFEELCNRYPKVRVLLLPGNHDIEIGQRFFASKQIKVFEQPTVESIDDLELVFVPYRVGKTIDEVLVELRHDGKLPERWVLIGHGDYIGRGKEINPYEPGVHMFITRSAINEHKPLRVILGHIHKPSFTGRVVQLGSPYPIDISETGRRHFIVYNTATDEIEELIVPTDRICFVETLTVFPGDDEIDLVKTKIDEMVKSWGLSSEEMTKVRLRLRVCGYCCDKAALRDALQDHLANLGIAIYEDGPDLSELNVASDLDEQKVELLRRAIASIDRYTPDDSSASKDQIITKIMEIVFEEKKSR